MGEMRMKWLFSFVMLTAMLGCGGQLQQLAVETMQNAQVALTAADTMGAQESAETPLRAAQEMFATAENALASGDAERGYRLALRAYLHARIATEIAIAAREEARTQEIQAELTLTAEKTAEALQHLERARIDLDSLQD